MRLAVLVLLVAACSKGQQAAPPPAKKDAAVPAADATVHDDVPRLPREAALPKRTPCAADCDAMHATAPCVAQAPGILAFGGEATHFNCYMKSVVIDCCAPINANDTPAIAKALGWEKASPAEAAAIAWVIARVVLTQEIIDEWPGSFPLDGGFTPPAAKTKDDDIVLTYWSSDFSTFVQYELTIKADGNVVGPKQLREVSEEEIPHVPETYKMSK